MTIPQRDPERERLWRTAVAEQKASGLMACMGFSAAEGVSYERVG